MRLPVTEYLDATLGETAGWGHAGAMVEGKWRSLGPYSWPTDRHALISDLLDHTEQGHDVYVCTTVLAGQSRKVGTAVDRRLLHVDIDHGHLDLDLVRGIHGWAVGSGTPGNGHIYVRLSEPVDHETYRRLNRALGAYLDGADAKIADNDVLRPPGTFNFKTDPARPVEFLVRDTGVVWELANLAARLGVDLAARPEAPREVPEQQETATRPTTPRITAAFGKNSGDRSDDTYGLVAACLDEGWSYEQTTALVLTHPASLDKRRGDAEAVQADVERCWEKVTEKAAAKVASGSPQFSLDDAPLAEWAAVEMRRTHCWSKALDGWLIFDGRLWQHCTEEATTAKVQAMLREQYQREIATGADSDRARKLAVLLSQTKIAKVVRLLRGLLERSADEFDQHPDLLNVGNGVVDLRTGRIQPHDPDLLLTKITKVDYVPGAQHPDWEQALEAVPVDVRPWFQVRLGQGITGHHPNDGVAPVLQGKGSNGKSTVLSAVYGALGGYAASPPAKVLTLRDDQHSTELTDVMGSRFAYVEELPDQRIHGQAIKRITGTPNMTARRVFMNDTTWQATHSLFITTNHIPQVTDSDDGTWRRLVLVIFPYRFVTDPRAADERPLVDGLDERVRDNPRVTEAVLSWLVDGARRWYADRSVLRAVPAQVAADTEAWRERADVMRAYVKERLVFEPGWAIRGTDLYSDYRLFVEARGYAAPNEQTFAGRFEAQPLRPAEVTKAERRLSTWRVSTAARNNPELVGKEKPTRSLVWAGVRFRAAHDKDPDQVVMTLLSSGTDA